MKSVLKLAAVIGVIAVTAAAATGGYKLGYGEGEIDPQLARVAAEKQQGFIANETYYEIGYGEGQVDPRLAAAVKAQQN